jgi:hypothetical protein
MISCSSSFLGGKFIVTYKVLELLLACQDASFAPQPQGKCRPLDVGATALILLDIILYYNGFFLTLLLWCHITTAILIIDGAVETLQHQPRF